jgi:hypothetical protein
MAPSSRPASIDQQLVVGDRSYTLRFSVRAMAALQDHFGLNSLTAVGQKLQESANDLSVKDMTALLWAGLRTHHPEVTMDQALGILDELGVEGMQESLGKALYGAMPQQGDAEGKGDPQ